MIPNIIIELKEQAKFSCLLLHIVTTYTPNKLYPREHMFN